MSERCTRERVAEDVAGLVHFTALVDKYGGLWLRGNSGSVPLLPALKMHAI